MYKAERITIAVIVVFMCSFTLLGWMQGYPRQAILFPILASGLVIAFAAMRYWEIGRNLSLAGGDLSQEERGELENEAGELEIVSAIRPFLWVFAALIFLWLFGFLAGLTLYVLAFLMAHRIGWIISVLVAAGTCVFVFVVFQIILGVLLPVGLILDLLGF